MYLVLMNTDTNRIFDNEKGVGVKKILFGDKVLYEGHCSRDMNIGILEEKLCKQ